MGQNEAMTEKISRMNSDTGRKKEAKSLENFEAAFVEAIASIGIGIGAFGEGKMINVVDIRDKINVYLGMRYSYNGNTSIQDTQLNDLMAHVPTGLAKIVNYKLIN